MLLGPGRTSRRAFTLVELLVVIAVIGILMGVLLPALGTAREIARKTGCLANTRSITMALTMYASQHDARYPHWSGWHVYGQEDHPQDGPGPGWTELIAPNLDESSLAVYDDPSRGGESGGFDYFLSSRYVFRRHSTAYTSLRQSEVRLPSNFVLSGDCNQPGLFPKPYGVMERPPDCDKDDATQPCVFFPGELEPHRGDSNIAFLDGHAGSFGGFDPNLMTFHARRLADWSLGDATPRRAATPRSSAAAAPGERAAPPLLMGRRPR